MTSSIFVTVMMLLFRVYDDIIDNGNITSYLVIAALPFVSSFITETILYKLLKMPYRIDDTIEHIRIRHMIFQLTNSFVFCSMSIGYIYMCQEKSEVNYMEYLRLFMIIVFIHFCLRLFWRNYYINKKDAKKTTNYLPTKKNILIFNNFHTPPPPPPRQRNQH